MENYLSDIIKEEYQEWVPGHLIFLSAHTGSGKTFFILNELVRFAALNGKKILYLVNRSILQEQIQEKINTEVKSQLRCNKDIMSENLGNVIEVKLYQTIENECKRNPDYKSQEEYDYIIADECHYFLEDATFNTYTQLSYEWIMKKKDDAVLIFISATIDRIKKYILDDNGIREEDDAKESDKRIKVMRGDLDTRDFVKNYDMKADYSYVKVSLFKKIEEIVESVEADNGKWLIFVDSIEKGRKMEVLLKEKGVDVAFITAESKRDEELFGMVKKIGTKEKYEQRVLIATSVMDNGISIKDLELRKLIIMAVTKEQFIQMLGRKRLSSNSEKLKLYILVREKEDFRKLLEECKKRIRFISEFQDDNFQRSYSRLLERMLESSACYQCAKNVCLVRQDSLAFSDLAIAQYDYLYGYYQRIFERFEKEGGSAFLREQLEWMGRENLEEIKDLTKTLSDRICEIIDEYKGRELSRKDNDEMREKARGYICQALECCEHKESSSGDVKKLIGEIKKKSKDQPRPISEGNFNKIMELLNLGYQMTKSNRSLFWISDKDLGQEPEKEKRNDKNLSEA